MLEPKLWLSDNVTAPILYDNHRQQKHEFHLNEMIKTNTRGDVWDRISLKEMLNCEHKKIYQGQSRFQNIHILEAREIRMFLDGQLQFSSLDERIYHEAFVHIPMALTKYHDEILILGGGDGLALREVLKYKDVKHVDLVDIDSEMLSIARDIPEMVTLNEHSLFDARVNSHAQDARNFLKTNRKTYDLIIIDFPDPADEDLAKLYSIELFQLLRNFLTGDGMIVCQSNSPEDTPSVYWSIGLTLEKANFYTESYHTIIPSFGDWGFHIASKNPIAIDFRKITVPHRTLPSNLKKLFQFSNQILSYKQDATTNSEISPKLHKLFKKETAKWI